MSEQYRNAARRCPQCDEVLTAQLSEQAELDWCDSCGGVYVDWMDGSLRELARQGSPISTLPDAEEAALRQGAQCPGCADAMQIERRDERSKDAWLRCPSCAGCFVPRSVWSLLGESDVHPKESSEPALTRFLDSIARFFVG